jgi:hypothetical protein
MKLVDRCRLGCLARVPFFASGRSAGAIAFVVSVVSVIMTLLAVDLCL